MKKRMKQLLALTLTAGMAASLTACKGNDAATTQASGTTAAGTTSGTTAGTTANETGGEEPVTIKIAWWGGQARHDYTQKLLDLYSQNHPNVTFEAMPSGWDGYFDKLATQAASGSMPDIVQMDYLYITTYAKNNSLADLQSFIDDGTIDVSTIDESVLNTGINNGKMAGLVGSASLIAMGCNPDVFAEAGLEIPSADWTWEDFKSIAETVKEKTGKFGFAGVPVDDTNCFNYWVRQHGESLFSADNKSLGYEDDKIMSDYISLWSDLMKTGAVPNPDEYAAISTLGQEGGPVVTGEGAMLQEWNNYANKVMSVNENIEMVTMPVMDGTDAKGLWNKPGYFWSIAETSSVKKEAAEFINWFLNSEEANAIIMAERGVPSSGAAREYMQKSGNLNKQQEDMFRFVDEAMALCGDTPAPDPVGMAEVNTAFKEAAYSAFYGQVSAEEAAAAFRTQANEILARNN